MVEATKKSVTFIRYIWYTCDQIWYAWRIGHAYQTWYAYHSYGTPYQIQYGVLNTVWCTKYSTDDTNETLYQIWTCVPCIYSPVVYHIMVHVCIIIWYTVPYLIAQRTKLKWYTIFALRPFMVQCTKTCAMMVRRPKEVLHSYHLKCVYHSLMCTINGTAYHIRLYSVPY